MFMQEKITDINKALLEIKEIENTVIWGAGMHTCKLFEKTKLLSYKIKSIVDIDKRKQGKFYFGFIIEEPEKIQWNTIQAVILSVPGKEWEIRQKLINELNYNGNFITFYKNNETTPFYQLYDRDISQTYYLGDYTCWDEANRECKGYDDEVIIKKVIESVQKVLHGEALWERDGYLFYKEKNIYPICATILKCAIQNRNQGVRILDIGGSLGSTYFQNKNYLTDVKNLEYIIAEQKHFTDYGKKYLEDKTLKFINSIDSFDDLGEIDIVLMSASLQYIWPNKMLIKKIQKLNARYLILDRIAVSSRTRICKEIVSKEIYQSSYPMMIYTEDEIEKIFYPVYERIEKERASVYEEVYFIDGKAEWMYYVFQRRTEKINLINIEC